MEVRHKIYCVGSCGFWEKFVFKSATHCRGPIDPRVTCKWRHSNALDFQYYTELKRMNLNGCLSALACCSSKPKLYVWKKNGIVSDFKHMFGGKHCQHPNFEFYLQKLYHRMMIFSIIKSWKCTWNLESQHQKCFHIVEYTSRFWSFNTTWCHLNVELCVHSKFDCYCWDGEECGKHIFLMQSPIQIDIILIITFLCSCISGTWKKNQQIEKRRKESLHTHTHPHTSNKRKSDFHLTALDIVHSNNSATNKVKNK